MEGEMNIYYDEEGDYLTIFVGEPRPNYGEDVAEGVTLFKDNNTNEVIGVGILDFRARARKFDEIQVKLPFKVNFSAI